MLRRGTKRPHSSLDVIRGDLGPTNLYVRKVKRILMRAGRLPKRARATPGPRNSRRSRIEHRLKGLRRSADLVLGKVVAVLRSAARGETVRGGGAADPLSVPLLRAFASS